MARHPWWVGRRERQDDDGDNSTVARLPRPLDSKESFRSVQRSPGWTIPTADGTGEDRLGTLTIIAALAIGHYRGPRLTLTILIVVAAVTAVVA